MLSLLDMSVAGGAVILAVAAIRALALDRLPKGAFTALWTVAVLRLLVPVSLPSPVSVYGLADRAVRAAALQEPEDVPAAVMETPASGQPVTEPAADAPAAPVVNAPAERPAPTVTGRGNVPWRTVVWAAGALGCGGFFALGYIRARRKYREAVEVQDDLIRRWQEGHPTRRRVSVRLSGRVRSPMTYGLFRPVVLLSPDTDFRDQRSLGFILAHEYGHIRRLDGLRKLTLAAAVCVHWFNPLVWVMLTLANRDMEMACDEAVVRTLDGPDRAAYARTLVRMEEARAGLAPLASHFSANAMEERITAIMKMKKWTAMAVAACIMLTIGVTAVFAASAPREAPPVPEPVTEPTPTPPPAPAPVPMAAPVSYDLGGAAVLFPLTEEGIAELFGGVDIRWWEPGEFAAWAAAQRPLLEAAVGSPSPASVASGELNWTAERTEAVMAALEDIGAALERGTGRLSRTVAGSGQVVLAVGLDLGLEAGAQGYDMDQLLWCGTAFTGSHTCDVGIGQRLVVLGPSGTETGLFRLMHAYYDTMVNAGLMDAGRANISLHLHWDAYQHGEMPEQWLVGGGGLAVPEEPEPEDLEEEPEPWYVRARPRYVWDLTGEEPSVREEASAETADYLLDIRPYGYRAPVNFDYVGLSGSAFSMELPPGGESTADSYDGQIDYLVIARSGGSFELIQRAVNGGEEQAEAFTEEPGGAVARRTGWYVEGGMELAVRNTGAEPLVIDGFIYR